PMLEEVSEVEGMMRAHQALERANASLPEIALQWTELAGTSNAPLEAAGRARLAHGEDVTLFQRGADHNRVTVYVPLSRAELGALQVSRTLTEEGAAVRAAILDQVVG